MRGFALALATVAVACSGSAGDGFTCGKPGLPSCDAGGAADAQGNDAANDTKPPADTGGGVDTAPDGSGTPEPVIVDPAWVAARLGDARLVTLFVHDDAAFAKGHLPDSARIDVEKFSETMGGVPYEVVGPSKFAGLMAAAGIPRDAIVVVYEEDLTWDGPRVFWTLEYYGHPEVHFLDGGLAAWKAAGQPVATDTAARGPVSYVVPTARAERFADADWVKAHLMDSSVKIVDARAPSEYAAGRIPGAVNVDWMSLRDGTMWKPRAMLASAFTAAGVMPSHAIVTYCQVGYRGAADYMILRHLGYSTVRVYDGSWAEWGSRADLPKEK